MATFYCVECNHETDERRCSLCGHKAESLEVKDDPVLGRIPSSYSYSGERDEYM